MKKKIVVFAITLFLLLSGMLVAVGGEAMGEDVDVSEGATEETYESDRDLAEENTEILPDEDSKGLESEALETSNHETTGSSGPYAKEGLLILRPIISVPEIVESGDTMEVWVRYSEGDADEDNWEATLGGDEEAELTVDNVEPAEDWEGDQTWRLTCGIDEEANEYLYNLYVSFDDGIVYDNDWSEDAVDVVYEIDDDFNFVHVSDTHFGWPGRAISAEDSINVFIDQMNYNQPDFIILTGDVCNKEPWIKGFQSDDPDPEYQDQFFRDKLSDLDIPIYIVHGNHDYSYTMDWYGNTEVNIESYKDHINPHLNYTFTYGEEYHFTMQNSGQWVHQVLNHDGNMAMDDVKWMDEVLEDNEGKTMRFVAQHHPAHPDRLYEWRISTTVRDEFLDSIQENDVNAVFAGHTHESKIRDTYGDDISGDPTKAEEPLHVTTGDIAGKENWEYREINIQGDEIESIETVNLWEGWENKPEIVDQVISPDSLEPGDTFEMGYQIENPHDDEDENLGLGATIRLSPDNIEELEEGWWHSDPENDDFVHVPAGETVLGDRDFEVPESAPAGSYDVAFGLWDGQPGDSKPLQIFWEEEMLEVEEDVSIKTPTESTPALIGDLDMPVLFEASIFVNSPTELDKESFDVEIGGESAEVVLFDAPVNHFQGNYKLRIDPPEKDHEGEYDLQIEVNKDDFEAVDVMEDAVVYSEGGNVDVPQVIDRSGSMSWGENPPIEDARDASKNFVDLMEEGDGVGVISYATNSEVDYDLTMIDDESIKEEAKDRIDDLVASGATDITDGLTDAYYELEENGNPGNSKAILHMTDGVHNQGPDPIEDSIVDDLADAGYPVYNVGLYHDELDEELLTDISEKTGGKYYYTAEPEDLVEIYNMIAGEVRNEMTLERVDGEMYEEGDTELHDVTVDDTVHSSVFSVTWTEGDFDLTVEDPYGNKIYPSEDDITHQDMDYREAFIVEDPNPGEWTMKVEALETSSPVSYTASVTAQADLTMNTYLDKANYHSQEPVEVRTILSDDGQPITNADVTARIERPDGSVDSLELHDDGMHGDGDAGNGIYANYYEENDDPGSYTIRVNASGYHNQEQFTRKTAESFYVKDEPGGISSPTDNITLELEPGDSITGTFKVASDSDTTETIKSSIPGVINEEGDTIGSQNFEIYPSTFDMPSDESFSLYFTVDIPIEVDSGVYNGNIVVETTANDVRIPLSVTVPTPPIPPITSLPTEGHELTIDSTTGGTVIVPGEDTFETVEQEVIYLEAKAEDGYHFVEWTGDNENIDDPESRETRLVIGGDHSITAKFAETDYELTIESTIGGNVTDPGEGTFGAVENEDINLEAVADDNYHFVEWTGDIETIDEPTSDNTMITMDGDKEITAVFEEEALSSPDEEEDNSYFEVEITDWHEEVETSDEVILEYSVMNIGSTEDTQEIVLSVNGEEFETHTDLTLDPDETYEGNFTFDETSEEGDYDLEVASADESDSITITVMEEEEDDLVGFTYPLLLLGVIFAVVIYQKRVKTRS